MNINPKKQGWGQAWVVPAPCQLRPSCTTTAAPHSPALPAVPTCTASPCPHLAAAMGRGLPSCHAAAFWDQHPAASTTSTKRLSWQRYGGGRSHPRQPWGQFLCFCSFWPLFYHQETRKLRCHPLRLVQQHSQQQSSGWQREPTPRTRCAAAGVLLGALRLPGEEALPLRPD